MNKLFFGVSDINYQSHLTLGKKKGSGCCDYFFEFLIQIAKHGLDVPLSRFTSESRLVKGAENSIGHYSQQHSDFIYL